MTTVLIAKLAGPYLLVTGLGFLCSTAFYERMVRDSAGTDAVTLNLSGAVHFLVGVAVVGGHFRWGSVAEVTVTLVGAAAAVKGLALIVVPELTLRAPRTGKTALRIAGVCFVGAGSYLVYVGYPVG